MYISLCSNNRYDGRLCIFEPDYRRGNDGTEKGKVSLKLVFV